MSYKTNVQLHIIISQFYVKKNWMKRWILFYEVISRLYGKHFLFQIHYFQKILSYCFVWIPGHFGIKRWRNCRGSCQKCIYSSLPLFTKYFKNSTTKLYYPSGQNVGKLPKKHSFDTLTFCPHPPPKCPYYGDMNISLDHLFTYPRDPLGHPVLSNNSETTDKTLSYIRQIELLPHI